MNKSILERIVDAQREFRRVHHHDPKTVHLTLEDEAKLAKLGWTELGTVLEAVLRHGVRKALPMLYGMQVAYDSQQFSIE